MADFAFPQVIKFEGTEWFLAYNPQNPRTVPPDLRGATITNTSCDPVHLPTDPQGVDHFLVMVDITYPAQVARDGSMVAERRLRAFRLYDYRPASLQDVQPLEMVYYIQNVDSSQGPRAQRFLDTIMGVLQDEQKASKTPDTSWCAALNTEPQPAPVPEASQRAMREVREINGRI